MKDKWRSIWQIIRLIRQQVRNITGYKRSISNRQNLSDVKMNRGSPVCNRKMFLNVKLERLWRSHHLQYRISSKDSESQEESLFAKDKAKGQIWIHVSFEPSGSTATKTDMILYWTSLHGLRRLNGKLFCGQINQNLKFVLEPWTVCPADYRGEGPSSLLSDATKLHLWRCGAT